MAVRDLIPRSLGVLVVDKGISNRDTRKEKIMEMGRLGHLKFCRFAYL